MTKKILIIIFGGIILFGLAGCGKMTKEEMLNHAEKLEITELRIKIDENFSKAKKDYNNKVYEYTDYVYGIEDNFIYLGADNIKVYLSTEEINKLSKGQQITIVGKLENLSLETEKHSMGLGEYAENTITGEMKDAYLVSIVFKVQGTFSIANKDNCFYRLTTSLNEVYCLDYSISEEDRHNGNEGKFNINGIEISDKDMVTIKGVIINNRVSGTTFETFNTNSKDTFKIKDIESIEINDKQL